MAILFSCCTPTLEPFRYIDCFINISYDPAYHNRPLTPRSQGVVIVSSGMRSSGNDMTEKPTVFGIEKMRRQNTLSIKTTSY